MDVYFFPHDLPQSVEEALGEDPEEHDSGSLGRCQDCINDSRLADPGVISPFKKRNVRLVTPFCPLRTRKERCH